VKELKRQIGDGCKMKMGQTGDVLVKRVGRWATHFPSPFFSTYFNFFSLLLLTSLPSFRGNIYVRNTLEETAVSNQILKLPHAALELDQAVKLFDMKKFQENLNRELKRPYPDRSKIETQVQME
jgi:hypothetical protein